MVLATAPADSAETFTVSQRTARSMIPWGWRAVARPSTRAPCSLSLCQPDKVADSHNLMVVLAHLQGVAATFRVGRHHHRGPLCEGRGLTHALTHIAPTDLTVAAALVRKACSKRRRSRLWSKPVNLRT